MDDDNADVRRLIGLGGGEPRCSQYTGTKALMMAVLEGGIRDYCGAPGPQFTAAEYWVRSNRRGPFSFAVVCETLALDPAAVRQALERLKHHATLPHGRIRPNLRKPQPTANAR